MAILSRDHQFGWNRFDAVVRESAVASSLTGIARLLRFYVLALFFAPQHDALSA
jgi:hypothetical protein